MANTTFSGPILAGGIKNTTGTTVAVKLVKSGFVPRNLDVITPVLVALLIC